MFFFWITVVHWLISLFPRLLCTELDSPHAPKLFRTQESRVMRVARGAGVQPAEVELLLTQYKKFADLVKEMGGIKVRVDTKGQRGIDRKQDLPSLSSPPTEPPQWQHEERVSGTDGQGQLEDGKDDGSPHAAANGCVDQGQGIILHLSLSLVRFSLSLSPTPLAGGMKGMENMIKQLASTGGGMGGMPDMSQLQEMMASMGGMGGMLGGGAGGRRGGRR